MIVQTNQQDYLIKAITNDLLAIEHSLREILSKFNSHLKDLIIEPTVDVYDQGDKFIILIDLPGVKKENIKLRVGLDYVEIHVMNTDYIMDGKPIKVERSANFRMYRKIELPCKIKVSDVKASLKDGVLYVILPKLTDYTESIEVNIE